MVLPTSEPSLDLILDVPRFYRVYPITFISFSPVLGPPLLWNYTVVEVKPGHSLANSCPTYLCCHKPSCVSAYRRSLHRSTILSIGDWKWQVILSTRLFIGERRSRFREGNVYTSQKGTWLHKTCFPPHPPPFSLFPVKKYVTPRSPQNISARVFSRRMWN